MSAAGSLPPGLARRVGIARFGVAGVLAIAAWHATGALAGLAVPASPLTARPASASGAAAGASASASASSRSRLSVRPTVRRWAAEDGLPQVSVPSIAQTPDGQLWFATYGGLARFGGPSFEVFDVGSTPAFRSNQLTRLLAASDGSLWIGGVDFLARLHGGRFERIVAHEVDGRPVRIVGLVEGDDGSVWVADPLRVHRFDASDRARLGFEISAVARAAGGRIRSIERDRRGRIVVDRPGRVVALESSRGPVTAIRETELFASSVGRTPELIGRDHGGQLLFGTPTSIARLDLDGRLRDIAAADDPLTALGDAEGRLWMIDRRGHWLIDPARGPATQLAIGRGIRTGAHAMLIDREGSVWVGTNTAGVVQVLDEGTRSISFGGIAQGGGALHGHPDGSVIVTTEVGVVRVAHGSPRRWASADSVDSPATGGVLVDPDGTTWLGALGTVFVRTPDARRHRIRVPGPVRSIIRDRSGAIHFGSRVLARLDPMAEAAMLARRDVTPIIEPDVRLPADVVNGEISLLAEASDGALWFGTPGQIVRSAIDGTLTRYGREDGVPPGDVRASLVDRDGGMWFGTYGGGLVRFHRGTVAHVDTSHGLNENVVSGLVRAREAIWSHGNRGVSRLDEDDLIAVAEGRTTALIAPLIRTVEGNRSAQPALWTDGIERLWAATIDGVTIIDLPRADDHPVPPGVSITGFSVDGAAMPPLAAGPHAAPPGTRSVHFDFAAHTWIAPDQVRYRYRLIGVDSDWVDVRGRRSVTYTSLPPGPHRFEVTASNGFGVWAAEPASVTFRIEPTLVQTLWFRLVAAGVAIGLLAALYGWRVARVHRAERRRALERSRRDIEARLARHHALTPLAVIEWDAAGRVVRWSPSAARVFGRTDSAALGRHWTELGIVAPHERERFARTMENLLAGAETSCRVGLEGGDARRTTLECVWHGSPVRGDDGAIRGVICFVEDRTAERATERERALLAEQLRHAQKQQAIGAMATGVAHDIKNAITALLAQAAMTVRRHPDDVDLATDLDGVTQASREIANVADALVALGRPADSRQATVDLHAVIESTLRTAGNALPASPSMIVDLGPDAPVHITGHVDQIQQAILNVVLNASEAMPEGGRLWINLAHRPAGALARPSATLEVDAEAKAEARESSEDGWSAVLTVRDEGAGMTDAVQARIFDPFFTTKPRGQGTGLGLSMVRRIVHDHSGRIDLTSAPGSGTTVTITFPAHVPLAPATGSGGVGPSPAPTGGPAPRVLLYDASPVVRGVLAAALIERGHDVVAVGTPDALRATLADPRVAAHVAVVHLGGTSADQAAQAALDAVGTIRPELDVVALVDDDTVPKRPGRVNRVVWVDVPVSVVELADLVTGVIGDRPERPEHPARPGLSPFART